MSAISFPQAAALATIFAVDVAQVRIALTDADLSILGLSPGFAADDAKTAPRARVTAIVSGAQREWTGRLARVEASVDPQTRLIYALVEVADPFGSRAACAAGAWTIRQCCNRQSDK
ncbi:MAG: hypothetical protein R3C42_05310 [Parvularculaceae bacterium]